MDQDRVVMSQDRRGKSHLTFFSDAPKMRKASKTTGRGALGRGLAGVCSVVFDSRLSDLNHFCLPGSCTRCRAVPQAPAAFKGGCHVDDLFDLFFDPNMLDVMTCTLGDES